MKDTSQLTACFCDHGGFLPLALKLGETYKRVLYHDLRVQDFKTVNVSAVGRGFPQLEYCKDFWPIKKEIDLFIFPNLGQAGLQLELVSQGFPVWGSRKGMVLEENREKFHRVLAEVGLEVPKFHVCHGITELRSHLRTAEDKVIKVSEYRGTFETCKWRSWALDDNVVDAWAVQLGLAGEGIRFLVFDNIDTPLELGCDTFNIRGQWPAQMIQGYEAKDKGFILSVLPTADMPEQVKEVLEAFGPLLADYNYANSFSMEIRVKGEHSYFIDPCCRFPMPPTGSKTEIWGNIAEVIAAGAQGELVEPEITHPFAAELAVSLCGEKTEWRKTEVPASLKQWLKFFQCCQKDDVIGFPPLEFSGDTVGWLVAVADTLDGLIEKLLGQVEELPPGLSADTQPLVELIKEIQTAEQHGIEFSEQEVPEPASVVS